MLADQNIIKISTSAEYKKHSGIEIHSSVCTKKFTWLDQIIMLWCLGKAKSRPLSEIICKCLFGKITMMKVTIQ